MAADVSVEIYSEREDQSSQVTPLRTSKTEPLALEPCGPVCQNSLRMVPTQTLELGWLLVIGALPCVSFSG